MPVPKTQPLDDQRITNVGLFFEAHAAVAAELEHRLEQECGLSVQWFEVLVRLARTPGNRLRMSDLAAQTILTPSGLTRAVDRLEAAGLVRREQCPSDRRGSFAALTTKGRRRIETAVPAHLRHIDDVLGRALSADEQATLGALARKLRDALVPVAAPDAEPCPEPTRA